jgi:ribose 5-phosphate isomerase B
MGKSGLKIAIDCDDVAVDFKKVIYDYLKAKSIDIVDLNYSANKDAAYPEIGYNLALKIQAEEYDRGILICGTGLGMAIIANKVEGVYAGVCHDVYSAERLRKSNNAQILTMGARVIGPELAKRVIDEWLQSEFEGGRSLPKVQKIQSLEKESFHKTIKVFK